MRDFHWPSKETVYRIEYQKIPGEPLTYAGTYKDYSEAFAHYRCLHNAGYWPVFLNHDTVKDKFIPKLRLV